MAVQVWIVEFQARPLAQLLAISMDSQGIIFRVLLGSLTFFSLYLILRRLGR